MSAPQTPSPTLILAVAVLAFLAGIGALLIVALLAQSVLT